MTPRYLYIHVPFCVRRCAYCDFAVEAVREPPVGEWITAIGRELRLVAEEQGWENPLRLATLYIGGGTPSLLGPGAMSRLREELSPLVELEPGAEWTCEANPESFTADLARDWRDSGVNRLSFGTQTFHEDTLRWMGRLHGAVGARRAVETARDHGFDNLSLDLIFGLPERLGRVWEKDLAILLELEPEHVSLYGLTAEEATPLGRWVREGRETLADEDRYADEYLLAHRLLTDAGYEHYEVSNFARPGLTSRHNGAYWTGQPYVALGPGAHSYFPPGRRWNERSWESYRQALLGGELPIAGFETVEPEQATLESVWLGLRTSVGYPTAELPPRARRLVHGWGTRGLARLEGDSVRLTAAGWLLLDRLAGDLADLMPRPKRSETRAAIDVSPALVQISAASNSYGR